MTKEGLFEHAKEKGWHEILEAAYHTHSLPALAGLLEKKESALQVELGAMKALGLMGLAVSVKGIIYSPTVLGIQFLQEENAKRGLTFSCQLCGTTTGTPHLCPVFYPETK